jgi:cell shape-determining protein MreC
MSIAIARPAPGPSRRPVAVLAALLCLAAVIGAALTGARPAAVSGVREAGGAAIGPIARFASNVREGAATVFAGVMDAERHRREAELLRRELAEARLATAVSTAEAERSAARAVISAAVPADRELVEAPVYGMAPAPGRRLLWVAAGAAAGVEKGMVAMGARGIVGTVERVFRDGSLVMLLDDPHSRWGAVALGCGETGVLAGAGEPGIARLLLERTVTEVAPGETLLTTGRAGSAAPGGIAFGTVESIGRADSGETVGRITLAERGEDLRVVFLLREQRIPWAPPAK